MIPTPDRRDCYSPVCGERQTLLESGTCQDCKDFERAQVDGTVCGPDIC